MDFLGKPFGPMPQLMAIAEYVSKVHAICVHCGNLAHHSHRLADNDRLVVLGEKDIAKLLELLGPDGFDGCGTCTCCLFV